MTTLAIFRVYVNLPECISGAVVFQIFFPFLPGHNMEQNTTLVDMFRSENSEPLQEVGMALHSCAVAVKPCQVVRLDIIVLTCHGVNIHAWEVVGLSENVVYIPNEIAIFRRDNDQQNHWV